MHPSKGCICRFLLRLFIAIKGQESDQRIFTAGIDKIYRSTASTRLIYG